MLFETDANDNVSAYIYNDRNELITLSRPLAAIAHYTYDALGNQVSPRDPENRVTTMAYDLRNRLSQTTNLWGQSKVPE